MTEPRTCWCGAPLPERTGAGRPREYCSPEHYRRIVRVRRSEPCTRCGTTFLTTARKPVCGECRAGTNLIREQHDELVVVQANLCAICDRPENGRRLSVDHDHRTGKVRELLCISCNWLIGSADDDPAIPRAAAAYVHKHRASPSPLSPVTVPVAASVTTNDATHRYEQVLAWHNEGMIFKEIGRRLGVSKQRAVQLWQQAVAAVPRSCWCGVLLLPTGKSGRPSLYCSPGHQPHPSGLLAQDQFDQMVTDQDGACAICGKSDQDLCVDIDQETERVRELLCFPCRQMLVRASDEPSILDASADYLEKHAS